MGIDKKRSHPSAPLYYPGAAPVLDSDQLAGSLNLTFPQIAGSIDPTQVPEGAVTQHADGINLDDLGDVNAPTPADGDALTWDDTNNEWVNTPLGGGAPHALDDHTDVNAPTPADGDLLTFDAGAGEWVNTPPGGGLVPPAEATAGGTVKVNTDDPGGDPVVYRVEETDTLLDAKQDKLTQGVVTVTTGSLANNAEETGTVALGKNGFLLLVEADVSCWVRLYGTAAERTADAGRLITNDPDDTVPVLADLLFLDGVLSIPCAPLIGFANRDGPVVTNIYYSIINKSGSTDTVTVDFTRLALES